MNSAGYTLTETLAAMAVIGFAISGFSLGIQVLSDMDLDLSAASERVEGVQAAQRRVERLLAEGAPYGPRDAARFYGNAEGFRFACAAVQPCEVRLVANAREVKLHVSGEARAPLEVRLPSRGTARFVYIGADGAVTTWPAGASIQGLRAVALVQGLPPAEAALFVARIWPEQGGRCSFDAVGQICD